MHLVDMERWKCLRMRGWIPQAQFLDCVEVVPKRWNEGSSAVASAVRAGNTTRIHLDARARCPADNQYRSIEVGKAWVQGWTDYRRED